MDILDERDDVWARRDRVVWPEMLCYSGWLTGENLIIISRNFHEIFSDCLILGK